MFSTKTLWTICKVFLCDDSSAFDVATISLNQPNKQSANIQKAIGWISWVPCGSGLEREPPPHWLADGGGRFESTL